MIWGFLTSRLGKFLMVGLAALAIVVGLFQYGKLDERKDVQIKDLKEYTQTKRKIDNVEISPSRDAAVERLRGIGLVRPSDM